MSEEPGDRVNGAPAASVIAPADDLLHGAHEIAAFLGEKPRRIHYLAERGELPAFRVGRLLYARKSTILRWLEALEAAALRGASHASGGKAGAG